MKASFKEATVRAACCYQEKMESGQVFIKIDLKNAFNILRKDSLLEAVAKHFAELMLQFTSCTSKFLSLAVW